MRKQGLGGKVPRHPSRHEYVQRNRGPAGGDYVVYQALGIGYAVDTVCGHGSRLEPLSKYWLRTSRCKYEKLGDVLYDYAVPTMSKSVRELTFERWSDVNKLHPDVAAPQNQYQMFWRYVRYRT